MAESRSKPRALFLFPEIDPKPDSEICSGRYPSHLNLQPCPYSDNGRIPLPLRDELDSRENAIDIHDMDSIPPCVTQYMGDLEELEGEWVYPHLEVSRGLGVYKCQQMFLLILVDD